MPKISTDSKKIDTILHRGVSEIIDVKDLKKQLQSGRKLRVKLGIDPTSPNLHLGRSVPLLKLRDFQELGHQIVFIVGDFTGVIGDTSDKDAERPMLENEVVKKNLQQYKKQAGKIIDLEKTEVRHNSEWLGKLRYHDIAQQANLFSVAEFCARENIRHRLDSGKRVSLREMLYPLMQGYDSVAIQADVEVGGMDQKFNLLTGRTMQPHFKQRAQNIIMNPLIEGVDGRKMSSSWGNTINFSDTPSEMYGKIMSSRDELIVKYFEFFTRISMDEIRVIQKAMQDGVNPRDYKAQLAFELVCLYHSKKEAQTAQEEFVRVIQKKEAPSDIREVKIKEKKINAIDLFVVSGLTKSKSEAKRLIAQKGVKISGQIVENENQQFDIPKEGLLLQKGKRYFVRVK